MTTEVITFEKDNPYSKYYTHGIFWGEQKAIGLFINDEFKHVESYDRYLEGVKRNRLLSFAEYAEILRGNKAELISETVDNKTPLHDNMKKISNGIYLVRTQAGFDKAINNFSNEKLEIVGYPATYPSVVFLTYGYGGYCNIQANCIHVNKMLDAIKDA